MVIEALEAKMVGDGRYYVGPEPNPDKYRLKRHVGSGGEAQLWEAELHVSGSWEPVAVKLLRSDRFADLDRWKARWAEQAEVLRFIRHPGVVGVREHFEGGGMHYAGEQPSGARALYLAMNWVDGRTLREWTQLHRDTADGYEALRYLAQVGDVLDWLHSGQATPSGRPVIHADVTPNNVIVTPAGQAVIVDFGLTRLAAGISPVVEGTGGYLAPEVKAAGAYSPASDRYAFGALTYFVLSGTPAPTNLAEIRAGLAAVPSVVAQPGALDHLMRMFDPDPMARPGCGDWIRSFRVTGATSVDPGGVGFTAPMSPSSPTTQHLGLVAPLPPPIPPGKSRNGLIAAVAIVLLLGAGIAFAVTRKSDDDNTATATSTSATPDETSAPAAVTSVAPTAAIAPTTVVATSIAPTTIASTTVAATTTTTSSTPVVQPIDLLAENTNYVVRPTSEPPYHMTAGEADVNGTHFKHATVVVPNSNPGQLTPFLTKDVVYSTDFDLARKFTVFQARIGVTDQSLADVDALVVVTVDGREVINQRIRLGQSIDAPIDVTGVLRLHIAFTGLGTPDDPSKFVTPAIGGPTAS